MPINYIFICVYFRNFVVPYTICVFSRQGLAAFLKAIGYLIPLMDPEYANYYTREVMLILIREFQSPDEEMKKIVLKVNQLYSIHSTFPYLYQYSNSYQLHEMRHMPFTWSLLPIPLLLFACLVFLQWSENVWF